MYIGLRRPHPRLRPWTSWQNQETTVASKLLGIFYEKLRLDHSPLNAATRDIKRAQAEGVVQQRVRRPQSWELLKGVGGGRAWIILILPYFMLLKALELFA